MLQTRLCELLEIELPILNAPMGSRTAGGELASAVSMAGGLGLIGAGPGIPNGAEWLGEQIHIVRERTDRPFGVGFISHWLPQTPELYEVALRERVPVIAHSFVDPGPYMEAARRSGAKVLCQVRTLEGARAAQRAGVDAVVAQGTEAGGHTGQIATLPLVPRVVDEVAPLPVIAAGGITDGRGLAAVLMLGAEGAWLGTAFLASPESGYRPEQKQQVLDLDAGDTLLTRSFDIAAGASWPAEVAGRAARNRFGEYWHGREDELERDLERVRTQYREAVGRGDMTVVPTWAGDGAGLVRRPEPAADVVRRIATEAEAALRARARTLLSTS